MCKWWISEFNFAPTRGYLNPPLTTRPWKQWLRTILEDKQGVLWPCEHGELAPEILWQSYLLSSFDMDAFKRMYSNNDTDVSVPYFWEHFNKEDYSIWFAEYMYKDELSYIFKACNLVGGMFQRLEKLQKTAFGSVCIFGKDKAESVSGIWIFRGQELAFNVSVLCNSGSTGSCYLQRESRTIGLQSR